MTFRTPSAPSAPAALSALSAPSAPSAPRARVAGFVRLAPLLAVLAAACAAPTSADDAAPTTSGTAVAPAEVGAPCVASPSAPPSAPPSPSAELGLPAAGRWEGKGSSVGVSGAPGGPFEVTLERTDLGAGKTRMDGTVRLPDGRTIAVWEETDGPREGYAVTSSNGRGGGRCFDNHMCQSYADRGDGHAFATTLVVDAGGHLRLVVTELVAGKAVRFVQQTLTRIR